MTSSTTFDRLQADALHIQKTARNLGELRSWLRNHLEVLSFGYTIPDDAEVEIKLNGDWNGLLSYAAQTHSLHIFVDIKVFARHTPHPALRGILDVTTSRRLALFSHESTLNLKLSDWPLATMIVAAKYLSDDLDEYHKEAKKDIREALELYVAKHFPGKSLAHLEAFKESGLLDDTSKAQVDMEMLADILFTLDHPAVSLIFPDAVA